MRKRFCLLPALALALLCACSKGAAKTPPTRPADFTSTERQFNTPADGDTIAIFDTSLGEVRAVLYPDAAPMAAIAAACKQAGLWPFIHFNRMHVAPPLVISEDDLVRGLDIIDRALDVADQYVTA